MKLQKEIQEGLIRLLVGALFPEGQQKPFAILTTAPGQWVSLSASANITIIDVTGITGPTLWVTEMDIRDRVLDSIRSAGWLDKQVKIEHGSSSIVPDLVVVDRDDKPLAAIELKSDPGRLTDALDQARRYAKLLKTKFGIATDGRQFLLADVEAPNVQDSDHFPTPQQLGQLSLGGKLDQISLESSSSTIVRPRTVNELSQYLNTFGAGNVIIDHTLPWGDRDSGAARQIRDFLTEAARPFRHLDSLTATLLLAASAKSVQRIVILLPKGVTFASQHSGLREFLVSRLPLSGVIDLPAGLFLPATSVPCTLVALGDFPIRSANKVAMVDVPSRGDIVQIESQVWFQDFKKGLQGAEMALGLAVRSDKKQFWSVSGALVAKLEEAFAEGAREKLQRLAKSVLLGDLCAVFVGFQHSRQESKPEIGIPVVRGRDLSSESLTKDGLNWFKADKPVPDKVKATQGDVLIQRIGSSPRCVTVGPDLEGAIASDTVIVLRPADVRTNSTLICQFLRSTMGQQLIQMGISGRYAPTISVSHLRTIPIPLFPEQITRELDELQQMEQNLKVRAEKIEAMRLNLFSAESVEDLENRLSEIRRVASVAANSMQQAETRDFQIRNFYPFPLAFCYRSLSGYTLLQELYAEQLNVAENILAFLGSVTLALITPEDRKSAGLVLQDLWRGGVSLGKWREICQTGSKTLERYETNRLARHLAALWRGKRQTRFAKIMEELVVARNEHHHNRGPKVEAEFRVGTVNLAKLLDEVMGELSFLTEYPILLVRDFNAIRGTRRVVVQTLVYVGDHPGLRQEQTEYQEALTKNDLYLQLRDDYWLPLYPFIIIQDCPRCRYRETYYIDRWDGPGRKTTLKSFERGHTEDSMEIGTSITNWDNA
jgi:hypothetical protein